MAGGDATDSLYIVLSGRLKVMMSDSDGKEVISTSYSGGSNFERVFGVGYFRKRVASEQYKVDQVIFAPFGDDPVLLSQTTSSLIQARRRVKFMIRPQTNSPSRQLI